MKNLAVKLVKILQSVESVEKTGWNDHQKYKYATEEDVLAAVKKALIENKVFISESSEITEIKDIVGFDKGGKEKRSLVTCVKTTHTFIDAESGETHTVTSVGQGHDSMDKGVFKAITGATKYFYLKNFMVSTGDDPEATNSKATKGAPVEDDFDGPSTPVAKAAPAAAAPSLPAGGGSAPTFLTANKAAPAPETLSKEIPKGIAAQGKVVNMTQPEPEF